MLKHNASYQAPTSVRLEELQLEDMLKKSIICMSPLQSLDGSS